MNTKAPLNPGLRVHISQKQVRFEKLVKAYGKPEVVTLWEEPKRGSRFLRWANNRQVVTLIQSPGGQKKQFGIVGYHPQPHVAYFCFPKALKEPANSIVIGIKFALADEGDQSGLAPVKPEKQQQNVKQPSASPVGDVKEPQSFLVVIERKTTERFEVRVSGKNTIEAKKLALQAPTEESKPTGNKEVLVEVVSLKEI